MTIQNVTVWIGLAAVLGFALGGSFVSVLTESEYVGSRWYSTFLDHLPDWFVALFTLLLAYVTHRLVTSTNKLWEAGERQLSLAQKSADTANSGIVLARQQFLATHRPRLRVRHLKKIDLVGSRSIVRFSVVNVGGSEAQMFRCRGICEWLDPRKLTPVIDMAMIDVLPESEFEVGMMRDADVPAPPDPRKGHPVSIFEAAAQLTLVAYGIIDYGNTTGDGGYRTAFCRQWTRAGSRLLPVDDPDYEYED